MKVEWTEEQISQFTASLFCDVLWFVTVFIALLCIYGCFELMAALKHTLLSHLIGHWLYKWWVFKNPENTSSDIY